MLRPRAPRLSRRLRRILAIDGPLTLFALVIGPVGVAIGGVTGVAAFAVGFLLVLVASLDAVIVWDHVRYQPDDQAEDE